MQSCSVHHCVLFLLTLTFTTDPGAAAVFPLYAKLHQSVTLPCETQCSGRGFWSLDKNRTVVFAQCDQTSCTSVQKGYEMSHDQYLRGDLSLTITNPDYSMRKTYTCECGNSDYATVRLRISTVSSAVQMQTEGDLKLDLSVPEPVEVIYRGSVLSDGVQICTVNRTLECNTEYTPRTSLSNLELTLRDVQRSESGTYTIKNLDYKEDIRVYAVSVSGLTSGETAGIVIPVLLLVLLIAGVVIYMKRKAEQKRREVKRDMLAVYEDINETLHRAAVEEELQEVEKEIKGLEEKYREGEHYGSVTMFCSSKREYLRLYREVFITGNTSLQSVTQEVKNVMNAVDDLIKKAELIPGGEKGEEMREAFHKINDVELKYSRTAEYYMDLAQFCKLKRAELDFCTEFYGTQKGSPDSKTEDVKSEMDAVDGLIQKVLHPPPGEEQEKVLQEAQGKIYDVQQKYPGLRVYWVNKREELNVCRRIYGAQKGSQQPGTEEVMNRIKAVYELIRQVKHRPAGEVEEVKMMINELDYSRDYGVYYTNVERFWKQKRTDLELCIKLGLLQHAFYVSKKEMDEALIELQKIAYWSGSNFYGTPSWEWIRDCCSEQRDNLHKFEQQLIHGETDDKMIRYMETHLMGLELWCVGKLSELEKYREKLKSEGGSDEDQQTPYSKEGGNRQETDGLLI